MRRRLRGLVAVTVPVLMVTGMLISGPASAATAVLDQQQTINDTQLWDGLFVGMPTAQVFTAGRTGLLDQVDVFMTPQNWYGPLDVSVTDVTGYSASWGQFQVPTGPALGFGEIYTNQNWPLWWSIPLSQPAPVTAGHTYALEFSFPPLPYGIGYDMFDGSSGPAPGYPSAVRFAGGIWTQQNGSVAFRTYVESNQPVLTVPGPISVPATSSAGAVVTYSATAVDDAGNPLTVSCSPASGSTFPIGTTSVTCSATDSSGDPATRSFDVTVQDTDLALSAMPDITANATSPSGATVSFSPSAVDEDAPQAATVTCSPASGSVFAIGTTQVSCTATDPDDSPSSVSASFSVFVLGPSAQLGQLGQAVQGVGSGASLAAKVQRAEADLAAGDTAGACATLNAFDKEVRAQSGKQISTAQADQLLADAEQIQGAIGC